MPSRIPEQVVSGVFKSRSPSKYSKPRRPALFVNAESYRAVAADDEQPRIAGGCFVHGRGHPIVNSFHAFDVLPLWIVGIRCKGSQRQISVIDYLETGCAQVLQQAGAPKAMWALLLAGAARAGTRRHANYS
jgi:hypothetical protein